MLHAGLLRDPPSTSPGSPQRAAVDWSQRFSALAREARDARLRAFYAAGAVSPDTPLQQVPLLALDVETTGLDPARDGIVSIGLVPMTLDRIRASQAANADTLRGHQIAETEAAAEAATERMTVPVAVLLFGFLVFIAYPAIAQITSVSGPTP